ncbi:AAA family ATPase [Polyangium spumosum]|uniref:AAA family ATPase n=1 Tax=Polyangium spumosum TaxID=889282 RepID=A0A6N7PMX8_9BACT|nr:AAA family ATPase [Polyangium spumosum]MRG93512.1 AAA family ATPase [Polyangium spumosum]
MLSWFEVENFKSIKKLRLELSPLMVFVGPNGAGKTNILQALALFLDMLAARSTEPIDLYGGYEQLVRRGKRPAQSMRFAVEMPFSSGKTRFGLRVDLTLKHAGDHREVRVSHEEMQIQQAALRPFRAVWSEGTPTDLDAGEILNHETRNWLSSFHHVASEPRLLASPWLLQWALSYRPPRAARIRLDASALRAESNVGGARRRAPLLHSTGEGLPLALERIRPRGKAPTKAFQRVLTGLQAVYPRIEDVSTIHYQPGRIALSFKERGIEGELSEANVSDGVIHALALLVALEGNERNVLAIEEPENALHPWALQQILDRAQDRLPFAEPLLISTHSPVVVDSVRDPASLYIVENHDKHGTIVTPALEKERALRTILANSGQKLGDVWLDGTLGGVPDAAE